MIYKDKYSEFDRPDMPYDRGDHSRCLNCKKNWGVHSGWNCDIGSFITRFDEIHRSNRYLTKEMQDSVLPSFVLNDEERLCKKK